MDELVDSGVKLLTIACNSASAAVLRDARERYTARYGIPVIEVIQPAVRRAVAATRTGRVGVIGTSATVGSRAYEDTFAAAPDLQITSVACPAFVSYVEAGITTGPELLAVAQRIPGPAQGRRRGHRGAGLHALPAADRRHLLRHGRGRHPGLQRRGNRQGRLPGPGLPRPAAHRRHRRRSTTSSPPATPRQFETPGPAFPGPGGARRPARGPRRGAVPHRQPGPDHPGDDRRRPGRRRTVRGSPTSFQRGRLAGTGRDGRSGL